MNARPGSFLIEAANAGLFIGYTFALLLFCCIKE